MTSLRIQHLLAGAALCWLSASLFGQPATSEPVERSMYFVERSSEATELMNANRPAEALPILEELVRSYSELDTDGYAAKSLGDCLLALQRPAEARQVFEAALAAHPDQKDSIERKLGEIDLAGEITDQVLARLQALAETPGEGQSSARWRLGRALQERAKALLTEAVAALRASVEPGSPNAAFLEHAVLPHAAVLESIVKDLNTLIASSDGMRMFKPNLVPPPEDAPKLVTERRRMEQSLRRPDGRRYQVELRLDPDSGTQVSVNGRTLNLTIAQKRLLAHYQDQINAILVEAADAAPTGRTAER